MKRGSGRQAPVALTGLEGAATMTAMAEIEAQRPNTILTLLDLDQSRHFYAQGFWRGDTMYTLLRRQAEASPGRYALRDTVSRLTYAELVAWVDTVAQDLHSAGLQPGERVSLWIPSRVESAIVLLACSRQGYVCNTSLHRDYTCRDIIGLLKRAGSAAFVAESGYGADGEDIFAMWGEAGPLKRTYRLEPLPATGATRFGGLSPTRSSTLPCATAPDRAVYLAFTSGTTGQPKGVLHSDNTLLANARAIAADWRLDAESVTYTLSPMSHNIGTVGMMASLVAGGEFVVHTPLDAKRTLDRVIETGASYLLGVPTHAIDLLAAAKSRGLRAIGRVSAFQVGGAPVPPSMARGLIEMGIGLQNSFGMTENCSFQYTRPNDPADVAANTCGRPCAGFEIKLFDPDNSDQEAAGGKGELGGRGACLMLGYFDDQAATERAFNADGWFMTGDLAELDGSGNLRIVGRKKDLIIRGGHNIHPAHIEDLAIRHDSVAKAAVFPVPDARLGERACIAVIPTARGAVDPGDLLRHLAGLGLSKYAMPEYFVEIDALPLTASGKVLKRRLMELVAEGAITPRLVKEVTNVLF